MKKSLRSLLLAMALVTMSHSAAFAEMVYNRGNSADPASLDPHKTSTVYEAHILRDLFEGLVMQDAKSNLIPGAAESWKVSDDGKVYTFTLRKGATWSNGDPVTADDFVYSFRRLEDPATAAEYASMLYVVKNAKEINEGKAKPEELGVKAVDAGTFEVTLNAPTPYFLEMLTHQANYPVHRGSIEKDPTGWINAGNLVSNGAYTLAENKPGDHIKLVKNPKFHDADSVKIDVVNYFPTTDRAAALKRFEAGELDTNDDMPLDQLADLRAKFGDQVRSGPYLGTYYYAIKVEKKPWSNPKLRRAISMAIDRDFLAEKVWGNSMIPGYSMVPPGIAGYEPALADYAGMSQIDRTREAKKILTELGYGRDKPLKLEIRYNTSENHKNTAVAIQKQLKPLGVEVTIVNTDTRTHYGYLEQKGDFDYARAGWIADFKDPETFLGISRKASGNNYSNYNSPKFEKLMDKAAAAGGNPADRLKLLSEAERVMIDDLGNMPLLYYSYHNLVSAEINGFEDNVLDVHPTRFISKGLPASIAALTPQAGQSVEPDSNTGQAPEPVETANLTPDKSALEGSALPATPDKRVLGRRIALVIGNSRYTSVPTLINPASDAEAIAKSLQAVGFERVILKLDLERQSLWTALSEFAQESRRADWAVIYFAGHGIELDGQNYVIPTDARLETDSQVLFETVPLDHIVEATAGARKLRLVILDACRNNPFLASMTRIASTRSIGRGLSRVEPHGGVLVAYAAKAGEVALDGEDGNSPFVRALIEQINRPSVEIGFLFRKVRDSVLKQTNGAQEPYTYGSLPGDEELYFRPPAN